jgi:hypothetical protein
MGFAFLNVTAFVFLLMVCLDAEKKWENDCYCLGCCCTCTSPNFSGRFVSFI